MCTCLHAVAVLAAYIHLNLLLQSDKYKTLLKCYTIIHCHVITYDNNYWLTDGQMDSSCVRNFMSLVDLDRIISSQYVGAEIKKLQPREQRIYFPTPRFTCGGVVDAWIVGLRKELDEADYCPELQIWRQEPGKFLKQASTSLCMHTLIPTAHANVYKVIPTDVVRFEQGDYVGLYQPPPPSSDPLSVTTLHHVESNLRNFVTFTNTVDKVVLEVDGIERLVCRRYARNNCTTPLVTAGVGKLISPANIIMYTCPSFPHNYSTAYDQQRLMKILSAFCSV